MEETSRVQSTGQLPREYGMQCALCPPCLTKVLVLSLLHSLKGPEFLSELGASFQQPTCVLVLCAVPLGIPEDRKCFLGDTEV